MENNFSLNEQNDKYFKLANNLFINLLDHISDGTENLSDEDIQKISKPMQGLVELYIENPKLKYTSNELLLKITNHIDEGLSNIQEMVDELNKYHNESINFKISDELELSISRFKKSMNRYVVLFSKSIQKSIIQLFTRLIQLIQKIMVSFHIFKYMLDEQLHNLQEPKMYNSEDLHIDDTLHELVFDLVPKPKSFNNNIFSYLKPRAEAMVSLYEDNHFPSAALECNVVIEGLLDINSNHMKKKMKNASTFEKLNKLSAMSYFNIILDDEFKNAFKKIRKYRNGVAHPKKYYNRDKNIATLSFYMLILINFIVRTNINMSNDGDMIDI